MGYLRGVWVRLLAARWVRVALVAILALTLSLGVLSKTAPAVGAYNAYTIASAANCYQYSWCNVTFFVLGGSDYYDCIRIEFYGTNGNYQSWNWCGQAGGWLSHMFYSQTSPPSYVVVYYYDSIQQLHCEPYY